MNVTEYEQLLIIKKKTWKDANCFGCFPCPQCKENYRFVLKVSPKIVNCDDCGFKEPVSPETVFYSTNEDFDNEC
jgi:Zn ribbon nucleic-acid-binding protein